MKTYKIENSEVQTMTETIRRLIWLYGKQHDIDYCNLKVSIFGNGDICIERCEYGEWDIVETYNESQVTEYLAQA